jgi:hypothetical protein
VNYGEVVRAGASLARRVLPDQGMRLNAPFAFGLVGCLLFCVTGHADEHSQPARRAPPPPFHAHPAGAHPHGPTVRPHPIRVLAPRMVVHGRTGWTHWNHPEVVRPAYYWDWPNVHTVTCIAEDSYGDQYPVSEAAPPGFGLESMTEVEDDAFDRCYSESGHDATCVLTTCTHI